MESCKKNLQKLNINSQLLNESIKDVDYSIIKPLRKNIVVYAYNPTSIEILVDALNKLRSVNSQKNIFLIYTNPQSKINSSMISKIKFLKSSHKVDIYKIN